MAISRTRRRIERGCSQLQALSTLASDEMDVTMMEDAKTHTIQDAVKLKLYGGAYD